MEQNFFEAFRLSLTETILMVPVFFIFGLLVGVWLIGGAV